LKDFIEKLIVTNLPSDQQRQKETWDVEGILHNQKYKFDLRPIKNNCKSGFFKSKADKMVFDVKDQWIILDVEELHQYLKQNELENVSLEELISSLDWNIILPKY
tara:strand:- start:267 stop:581 length:315 start_codon:yes stop_codon:yes gene_type:complete